MSLPDYLNDYDLLFNSKEIFISAKTQSLFHKQTYCILKNTEKFPSSLPCTVKHSSGNSLTLSRGQTVFGSLEPSPRALLFPLGGGLQSILRLRVRSEAFGVFSASRIGTEGRRTQVC